MKVLFANPPWFEHDATGRAVRGGIRAGSRWPFTRPQPYVPGRFAFGSYLPFPFFLAGAAGWMKAQLIEASNPEWRVAEAWNNCRGLLVLERNQGTDGYEPFYGPVGPHSLANPFRFTA